MTNHGDGPGCQADIKALVSAPESWWKDKKVKKIKEAHISVSGLIECKFWAQLLF